MNLNRRYLGAAASVFGAFTLWVGSDTFIKLSGETLELAQQIAINLFFAMLVVLVASLRGQGLRELKTKRPLFHLGRGLTGGVGAFSVYYAVTHMPLANFYTIEFTLPFMIALQARFF